MKNCIWISPKESGVSHNRLYYFKKTFILDKISEPTSFTVTTENGGGKLVLTCLTPTVIINGVGGRNSGAYNATLSKNYLVNGEQIVPHTVTGDDGHWGRVEIIYASGSTDVTFMNVIYVTDKGSEAAAPTVERIDLECGLAARVGATVAVFVESFDEKKISIDLGDAPSVCYISGLCAGKWTDGESTYELALGEELLKLTASGKLTLTYAE